ncbi:MAG: 16S rRNA (cytidine(1402)-2'-O)-methyltransferase [Clostridiales bacterium]|jgi:16S rRNA (cytidine1402-2'-O)-methyltransferase|nr:16S rRNA (cytidine(1402)-2'-O)-methyltransferase [Clostridiales bacterium]
MSGTLYLVATPIGNLGDFSPRAVETLKSVDFIAAEDTRVTIKLLNHFGIKKPLISYFEHNRIQSGEKIIERLKSGENVALVSDAGMPAISDPGEDLVRLCAREGVQVLCIPGACAAVSALAVSGQSTQRFTFEGFLSTSGKSRAEHLESLKNEKRTMIIYEAPHKLMATLADLKETFGGDRELSLCREITKLHEETIRTTIDGAIELYTSIPPKGEYVLVVKGRESSDKPEMTLDQALERVELYRSEGKSLKQASKLAAEDTGYSKNVLYNAAVERCQQS